MSDTLTLLQQRVATSIRQRSDDALALIAKSQPISPAIRLGVYQDAYLLRLDEALRGNFPKLHVLLGDESMMALTTAYVAAQPSRRPSIRWFGDQLPAFLATHPDYAPVPALADLARFEWALCTAFDAADADTVPATALGTLSDDDWPALRLTFHPSLQPIALAWNCVAVWRALDTGETPPNPSSDARNWAIWRQIDQPHYRSLGDDEAALLRAMQSGLPLATACESLLPWHDEDAAPAHAAGLLGRWLHEGWIRTITGA